MAPSTSASFTIITAACGSPGCELANTSRPTSPGAPATYSSTAAPSMKNSTRPRAAASVGQPSVSTASSSVACAPRTSSGVMMRVSANTARISVSIAAAAAASNGTAVVSPKVGSRVGDRPFLRLDVDRERRVIRVRVAPGGDRLQRGAERVVVGLVVDVGDVQHLQPRLQQLGDVRFHRLADEPQPLAVVEPPPFGIVEHVELEAAHPVGVQLFGERQVVVVQAGRTRGLPAALSAWMNAKSGA